VAGYTTKAVIQTAADRVSKLDGRIDFVAFDSPVAFGHFNILNKPNACTYSIQELAQNIGPQIEILRAAFPGVVFGDVEPVNNHTVGWLAGYLDFAKQFQQQTGERLSFLQADIIWYDNWRPQLVEFVLGSSASTLGRALRVDCRERRNEPGHCCMTRGGPQNHGTSGDN
jgi:hypothetical protein